MAHTRRRTRLVAALAVALLASPASGAGPKDIALPNRPASAQADLVQALENRKSVRDYRPDRLTMQDLSAVLWAANGVNRDYGRRTAPSAFGNDYIDLYVVGDEGAWRYDAPSHRLKAVAPGDLKGRLTSQRFVARASHVLVLVADPGKFPGFFTSGEERKSGQEEANEFGIRSSARPHFPTSHDR